MNKTRYTILSFLVFAAAGAGGGHFLGKAIKSALRATQGEALDIPVLVLTLWLAIFWHEAGHAIGGWLAGFRMHLLAVGPLRVERVGGRLRWGFNRSLGTWGGMVVMMPEAGEASGPLRWRMLRMVAAGPVASLAGGLLAVPGAMLWPENPKGAAVLYVFSFLSASLGIGTLLPISNHGFVNDGLRIVQLWRGNAAGMRWLANVALSSLAGAVRPRQWPGELAQMDCDGETYDGVAAMWLRYLWHLDRKEFAEAKEWLESALECIDALAAPARPTIHASAADFYSRIEPAIARAKEHLREASKPGMTSENALAFARASVPLAEGKGREALEAVERGRAVLSGLTGSSRESAAEIFDEIEAKARVHLT